MKYYVVFLINSKVYGESKFGTVVDSIKEIDLQIKRFYENKNVKGVKIIKIEKTEEEA